MDARLKLPLLLLVLCPALLACTRLSYYAELAQGQLALLQARENIESLLEDEQQDPALKRRLQNVMDARRFAVKTLALPDNKSYTLYADLERSHVLWNILATPEFSLDAVQDCFPIAGCVAYRGHFREIEARKQAEQFRAQGFDVITYGVSAYSTLGWFNDPVLNTMLQWRDADLIGTIFHELAHQQLYVQDDTAFNESFASFVEQQGLKEYFGQSDTLASRVERRRRDFTRLILEYRQAFESLYQQELSAREMRLQKAKKFSELELAYRQLRHEHWNGVDAYGTWFAQPLNNASLLPFGLYDQWVGAFQTLFEHAEQDWTAFFRAAAKLGELPHEQRQEELSQLLDAQKSAAEETATASGVN